MHLVEADSGALVLNDAYNANRTSTEAALRALAGLDRPRKTAVLGLMAELGDAAPTEHAAVADVARKLGVRLIAFGTSLYGMEPVETLRDAEEALGDLGERDAVLVKGSRVNELERLVDRLLAAGGQRSAAGGFRDAPPGRSAFE
jgi:UDP-N-acetylmuramoyl-tripeptide--D-alanyl-D-alanine ligase